MHAFLLFDILFMVMNVCYMCMVYYIYFYGDGGREQVEEPSRQ